MNQTRLLLHLIVITKNSKKIHSSVLLAHADELYAIKPKRWEMTLRHSRFIEKK